MTKERLTSAGQLRFVVLLLIGVAAIILAVQNPEAVHAKFLSFETTMPQFALLLLTGALGFIAGYMAARMRKRKP